MEKNVTLSTRVPSELAAQVDFLSQQYNRSRSWLLQEAVSHYVANELEFITAVQEGVDDITAGRLVPHGKVVAELEKRRRKWRN